MKLIFAAKSRIEFIGDSITDCDRQSPEFQPLGRGYVRNIHQLLQSGYPELNLQVINKGISGDRVTDLHSRWTADVLDINPDWLFIYIGINDVWRFIEGNPHDGVSLDKFSDTYHQLINAAQSKTRAQIQLIAPFLAESDTSDAFRIQLAQYQAVIEDLGWHFNLPVILLQPAFDRAMRAKPAPFWSADRVHPSEEGHMLIALSILRACGFHI